MIKKIIYTIFISLILQINIAYAGSTGSEELKKSQNTADECFEGFKLK